VIALGQSAAGDDGVGLAVLEALRARGVPEGVELVRAAEDSALVALLETSAPVVLVDAVLGSPPGEVVELAPEELAPRGLRPVSTHGLGVAQALALARALAPGRIAPLVRIVAVTIAQPVEYAWELSPAVAAAAPRAVERVLALLEARSET
jgi:hydrogenase maturation protease